MKPTRLELDPNSSTAAKEWKHWRRTFENYLTEVSDSAADANKLRALINSVKYNVYDYIEGCTTYEAAINVLESLYVKKPNAVFARHRLATAKQQPGQSLDEFLQHLKIWYQHPDRRGDRQRPCAVGPKTW